MSIPSIAGTVGAVSSGFQAAWSAFQALVKAGMSSGALQMIAGAVIRFTDKGDASDIPLKKHCALAVADVVEFEPESDNVEALTNAIARLSYVLEEELKRKKAKEDAAKANG